MKFILLLVLVAFTTSCAPLRFAGSTVATAAAADINALAAQATQAFVDYKAGNVNYAWAVAQGLQAYQTIIHSEADFKAVVSAMGGSGTLADKLAHIFAVTTSVPPAQTVATIANTVQVVAGANTTVATP